MNTQKYFNELLKINWDNLEDVSTTVPTILRNLAFDKIFLKKILLNVKINEKLFDHCEHYDILDKIVLYFDDKSDIRLRLHVFLPGYYDRPHNHRWTYSSYIIRGEYKHTIYESKVEESFSLNQLKPILIRKECQGDSYTLHHNSIHSVVAEPYTISIVARGPSTKNKFLVSDRKTGETWWQFGTKYETQEQRLSKRMSYERFDNLVKILKKMNVI